MKEGSNKRVGELIRRLRDAKGITQMELAERVGLSYQQIQKYEKGRSSISLSRLRQIAHALDVPISEFFEKDDYVAEPTSSYQGLSEEERRLLKFWQRLKGKKIKKLILQLIKEFAD